jgi:hypothetical protein
LSPRELKRKSEKGWNDMNDADSIRIGNADISPLPVGTETDEPLAWEMIEEGRYMPRRIRGSYRGRVLG